ncbi:MAG TPA: HD domain-containing protein, partial [Chloroflexota bacterium]|nr:HD domain-containing protein [Chloroflexota bacterium]
MTAPTGAALAARSPQGLFDDVARYLPVPDVEAIKRAYAFAAEAHAPQLRESGEPYINHPLAVAETLAALHLDAATIVAALLHD